MTPDTFPRLLRLAFDRTGVKSLTLGSVTFWPIFERPGLYAHDKPSESWDRAAVASDLARFLSDCEVTP